VKKILFVDSGTIYVLKKWICNDDTIYERIKSLADTLNYQVYWDHANAVVVFEPEGTQVYATPLTVGGNVTNVPVWVVDITNMVNKLKVKGANRRDWDVETFSGDDAETDFTLTYTPKDTEVYIGAALQVRGVEDSIETFDYVVDEDRKRIEFEVAPTTGSSNITVNYSHDIPIPVYSRNQSSIDTYGLKEDSKYFDDIRTIDDAKLRGSGIISKIGIPFNKSSLYTIGIFDLIPGKQIRAIDTQQGIDLPLTVQSILYQYPQGVDVVNVGDEDFRLREFITNIAARVRELEKSESTNEDLLVDVIEFVRRIYVKRRYAKLQKIDATPDGAWGIGFGDGSTSARYDWAEAGALWQASYTNAATTEEIIQGNNVYEEFIYDNDFFNTGTTTATIDNSGHDITFTTGEILQGSQIALGGTYNHATFTINNITTGEIADLTLEVSFDNGSNYQEVSNALKTHITDTDATGILYKITAGDSVVIENLSNSDLTINPAISILLEE